MFSVSRLTEDDDSTPCPPNPPPTLSTGRSLRVHGPGDPQRAAVEAFIRQVYAEHHGATVRHFTPTLVSLCDDGQLVAAAGYRFANEALFLERYLDVPIEAALARQSAHGVPARSNIVEVGHLAANQAGAGRKLILALGAHLAGLQVQWVVSTLTQELRHLFVRMGVTPLALGVADPSRLGSEAADWGSYYDHSPVVLAGQMSQALRLLRRSAGPSGSAA